MNQIVYRNDSIKAISDIIKQKKFNRLFLVCGNSFDKFNIKDYLFNLNINITRFSKFSPNPKYKSVREAIDLFNNNHCDSILAIGGGSAIDIAKCIKNDFNYINKDLTNKLSIATELPFIAIPTTAGSGSEATRFAVYYIDDEKQSINNINIIPNYVILDYKFLYTLPEYQKKCTLMDAFCQAIESYWSINSNNESKDFSSKSIKLITKYWKDYIFNPTDEALDSIMLASYYAGKSINITQTTAAHAMSYKLTSMYNLPHGHAVAICLPAIWDYMINHFNKCCDKRGTAYLGQVFFEIAKFMDCETPEEAINFIININNYLKLSKPVITNSNHDLDILSNSVNQTRLKNNPVLLNKDSLYYIYERIFQQ